MNSDFAAAPKWRRRYTSINKAEAATREEQYDMAIRYAEQAEADARLAEARARTAKSQKAVAEVQDSIKALQEELQRTRK